MNDKILAAVRSVYQFVIGLLLNLALRYGFDIPNEALDAVLWPVVQGAYYLFAQWVEAKWESSKISKVLLGPGPAPVYNEIPDEVLEGFLS